MTARNAMLCKVDVDDLAEVTELSDAYEAALRQHEVDTLDAMFWSDPAVLRFGVDDVQYGHDELTAWRSGAPAVHRERVTIRRDIVAVAPGVVAVDLTFRDPGATSIGRQSQTWVRREEGWRIVRAHVSLAAGS